jgi:hypothetical protein
VPESVNGKVNVANGAFGSGIAMELVMPTNKGLSARKGLDFPSSPEFPGIHNPDDELMNGAVGRSKG